ncbi:uncharacterized protein LACBIDRAFT_334353 [Laccaria bicolor S238N-H82]|uniref:Predicted protein n=1 Tax=Laccaria bicolor (strain S238N-H82 / ATCC MYA-4686) TaxID=486041 RepID=B0DYY3_LACBS|nr:uncharacterized protein LACBIDRAFT_334353 [Laccaria bicolor S238N-H82]EDR00245.1 predicted protein [Laccaria bicolor S238N-H82]|eukprot:XP_001889154.1 predicted protein [Laccaria bicolor S238N-H82]
MNARALKLHLRDRLCSQKFELDWIERSYHKHINEQKVHHHLEDSVKRCDPSIQRLTHDYNNLVDVMLHLKSQHKAPARSVCPSKIIMAGLFTLDVDDDIWQDISLDDTLDCTTTDPPLWLCNDHYFTLLHEFRQIPLQSHGMLEFHWESTGMVGMYNSCGFPWIPSGIPGKFHGNSRMIPMDSQWNLNGIPVDS